MVVPCAQSETEERGLSARQYLNPKKGLAMPRETTDGISTIVTTIDPSIDRCMENLVMRDLPYNKISTQFKLAMKRTQMLGLSQ